VADHIIVITGAGASFDCVSGTAERNEALRPPLVTQLFAPQGSFPSILANYPLAQAAATDIRPAMAEGSIALEAFLREQLRESPFESDRRRFAAVPLYLQHLFFQISDRGFTAHPDNYDRLVNAALRIEEPVFVTLNYDTLLDQRLFAYSPLTTLESYIDQTKHTWALIKLHGSINWGRAVLQEPPSAREGDTYLAQAFAELGDSFATEKNIDLRLQPDIRNMRYDGGRLYYPALSAPLGSEDELVCPESHIAFLKERLERYDGLNLLVIGYSGLDRELRRLLTESGNEVRSLMIVNGTEQAGNDASHRLLEGLTVRAGATTQVFLGGFNDFAASASLPDYFKSLT
jgi:hypothetical protein